MTHTPGPWYIIQYGPEYSLQKENHYSEDHLLDAETCPEAEANAHLCTLAPEMIDLLKKISQETNLLRIKRLSREMIVKATTLPKY